MGERIDAEESASILGIKVGSFHAYRRSGRLAVQPVAQVGNSLIFDRTEVEAEAARRVGAGA